jgi:Protein of unknown function (DUF1353)
MRRATWEWGKQTAPFSALDDAAKPAAFVVEQISDKEFAIPKGLGFRYGPPEQDFITVTRETLPSTDFASIPRYMSWLVSRHGRHTPAALVHDQLVKDGISFEERQRADRCFVEMMDATQVPFVLSRVMGTAVSLATRWRGPFLAKVGIVLWGLLAGVGIAALIVGLITLTPWLIALSLLLPALGGLLWGRQFVAGVVGGYALPVIAAPAVAALLGYWVYWVIEMAVRGIRSLFHHDADKELPTPIGYQGR